MRKPDRTEKVLTVALVLVTVAFGLLVAGQLAANLTGT